MNKDTKPLKTTIAGESLFNDGVGGGHSWLQEHLKDNYHSAWHAWRVDDAAILNKKKKHIFFEVLP